MTSKQAVDAGHLGALERLCRANGLRLTVQKRAVLVALLARGDHPTADALFAAVSASLPGVSRATIYRILEGFVRIGIVSKQAHPGAAVRYDANVGHHHHLHCVRCDRIVDLDAPRLDRLVVPPAARHGFQIEDYSIFFRGVCAECRSRARGPGGKARKA